MVESTAYGTIVLSNRRWVITCEPHVRARIKRFFPRVQQHATDTVAISDTPENCRDLECFLHRYPMTVSDPDRMAAQAQTHVTMERDLAAVLARHVEPMAFPLHKPARDYQRVAASMAEIRHGLLLADDVGTGKTVSAICPLVSPGRLPAVVVVPAFLPDHWPEKLAEFVPHLRVHTVRTSKPYPLIKREGQRIADLWDTLPDVIVISYHKLRGWAGTLAPIVKYVIFEEAQQLRRQGTDIYRAAKHLAMHASLRIGLSATPIYNYGAEFFWVIDAILPGALGEHDEFVREWCRPDPSDTAKSRIKDAEQFGAYLRREGIMLRRSRKDVGRELPPLTIIPHEVNSDATVLESLSGDAVALAKIIMAHNEQYRGQKMQAAGEFDGIMRQATGIAKAPYVAEFVRMLVENGEQVLLFGWHRAVYNIWMEALAPFHPVLYTGTESPTQKRAAKEAFVSGAARVMLMSLRSGAGLDGLQHVCRTVVIGELDWSPGVHEQCIGRPHRDGQTEPVTAFYLISADGSDPIMVDVLGIKREQIDGVRDPVGPLVERIETGENQLRRLAQRFLESKGIVVPSPSAVRTLPSTATHQDHVNA